MRRLALLAPLLIAAAPPEVLTIAGERFAQAEILDARAVADGDGPAIFITFTDAATKRFSAIKARWAGKPVPVLLGDRPLTAPMIFDAGSENAFQIPGQKSFPEAEALARRISGKAPLPESLEE